MTVRGVLLASVLGAGLLAAGQAMAGQAAAPPAGPVYPASNPKGGYTALDRLPDWGGVWIVAPGRPAGAPAPEPPRPKGRALEVFNKMRAAAEANHGEWPMLADTCAPRGVPYIMSLGQYPTEIIFSPGRVTMLHEERMGVRRIFTDGRPHPPEEDAELSYFGDSIGRWEGDTLVVETIRLKPSNQIANGIFVTPKTRVVERFHLDPADPDILMNEMTVYDDEVLEKPFQQTIRARRRRDIGIIEFVCAENNRNPLGEDGKIDFQQ